MPQYTVGQRVSAIIWGVRREGTVTQHTSSIVWVRWDGSELSAWQHPDSLSVIEGAK